MLNTFNVEIEGYVGNHPELRVTSTGEQFVKIQVATNHKRIDKNKQETVNTYWHSVYFNGALGNFAANGLSKGTAVQITGRGDFEQWQDKNQLTHTRLRIYAERLRLLAQLKAANENVSYQSVEASTKVDTRAKRSADIKAVAS